jgi:hypothetical protein
MPARKYPKPLSTNKDRQVDLKETPSVGDTFLTSYGKAKIPLFLVVTDVAEYVRAKDQTTTHVIAFQDEDKNYYSSGLCSKSLAKHGHKKPDIYRQRRANSFALPEQLAAAEPIGPNGMSVRLKHVPNIGDIFWTFPNNDNTKPKLYVKVTNVTPYISRADGTQRYLIAYTCKDNKTYSSQLESYKLVNLSDDPFEHRNAPYNQAKKKETQDA